MDKDSLTPEKSLELITRVITEARERIEENGFIYMFWGALIALVSFGQFALLHSSYREIHYYPYFLIPAGVAFSGWYNYRKQQRHRPNQISKMVTAVWVVLALNMMLLGFVFGGILKQHLIPVILILQGAGMVISGSAVKSSLLLYAGIAVNISGLVCFYLDWPYHPLLAGIVAIVAIFVPGMLAMIQHRKGLHA